MVFVSSRQISMELMFTEGQTEQDSLIYNIERLRLQSYHPSRCDWVNWLHYRYNRDILTRDVLMVNDLFCKPQDLYLYNKVCQKIGLFLFIYSPSETGFLASFFLADLFSRQEMVLPRNYFRFWEEIFLGINFPVQKYFRAEISSIWITFLAGLFLPGNRGISWLQHFMAGK